MADGDIEWFVPEYGKGGLGDIVSHFDGVEAAVRRAASSMASDAWLTMLWHHRTGAARIRLGRHPNVGATSPDWYVFLEDQDPGGFGKAGKNKGDRSAMSIEFGWTQTHAWGEELDPPISHPGIGPLSGAMARAAKRYKGKR